MADETDIDDAEDVAEGKAPKSAKSWLKAIETAQKAFEPYQTRCNGIDKLYADLEKLANTGRDREFQMFWANIEVLKPSVYSRPPVPVIVPRFQDGRPLYRLTSELLERSTVVAFEVGDINAVMKEVRDDLVIAGRGAPWVRYETKKQSDTTTERACIEHVDRGDFLHDPARKWAEVGWVAKRSWLTKAEMRKRFGKISGKAYQDASYGIRKDAREQGADDGLSKAGVWEIWSKTHNKVVWVADGCEVMLDEGKPHLTLDGFFPCPRPAYATLQRRSLVPVPDVSFYKDQLEEVNQLTARIDALTDAIKIRGFYPSGASDLADAIEVAVKNTADNAVLVGVANWAATGAGSLKDTILWMPVQEVAAVVKTLIELRRQVIDDIYQITGLSDIMRGATAASETATAQQLKSQYGSIRIRDRQEELIRVARDLTRIVAEIMAENFDKATLLDMSQMDIPSDADMAKKIRPLEQQAKQIEAEVRRELADPETQQLAQQHPDQAKKLVEQAQGQIKELLGQIEKLKVQPTIEAVMKLLRDQRIRPFILDIETDSTIEPDENAQKQRATEYLTAMGGLLAQAVPAIQQIPEVGPLIGETIRFAQQQFRVGRQLDGVVDQFVEGLKARQAAPQQEQPDPGAMAAQTKAQSDAQSAQADQQVKLSDAAIRKQEADVKAARDVQAMQARQAEEEHKAKARADELDMKAMEAAIRRQALEDERTAAVQKHQQSMEEGVIRLEILRAQLAKIVGTPTPQPPASNQEAA
jgi:hypothetical protein